RDQRRERLGLHLGGGADAEDVGIARGGDFAGGGRLYQHRHLVLLELRHDGQRQRRAPRTHHDGYLSRTINFSAVATASVGLDLLSSTTSSIFLPSTPPALLISSSAILAPCAT